MYRTSTSFNLISILLLMSLTTPSFGALDGLEDLDQNYSSQDTGLEGESDGETQENDYREEQRKQSGWSEDIFTIVDSLENLQDRLPAEEWEDYANFGANIEQVAELIESGVGQYSGKVMGYLFVAIEDYNVLVRNGIEKDLDKVYRDGRGVYVKNLVQAVKRLTQKMASSDQVRLKSDGTYELSFGVSESIVNALADSLLDATGAILDSGEISGRKTKAFTNLEVVINYIKDELSGMGDSSCEMQNANMQLVDTYDWYNRGRKDSEYGLYTKLMMLFAKSGSKEINPDLQRRRKFRILASKVENLIQNMEYIKGHISYGIDYEGRTTGNLIVEVRRNGGIIAKRECL